MDRGQLIETMQEILGPEGVIHQREELRNSLRRGRAVDWDLLEPFLRVPHERGHYRAPQHDG